MGKVKLQLDFRPEEKMTTLSLEKNGLSITIDSGYKQINSFAKGILAKTGGQKRIEENEAFRLEVEVVLFVCKDLTQSVDSTAVCVNAIQHLNDIIEKYKTNE